MKIFENRNANLVRAFRVSIAGVLLFAILPISWILRPGPDDTVSILIVVLAMPLLFALLIGKGVSKPDFWSTDMSVPAFIAVRPLRTIDMVLTKLKVAGWSVVVTWIATIGFVSAWLDDCPKFLP